MPPEKILNFLSIICICCISSLSLACDPLTSPREQFLWKQSLSDGKLIEGQFANYYTQGQIIALGNQFANGKVTLYSLDASTGEVFITSTVTKQHDNDLSCPHDQLDTAPHLLGRYGVACGVCAFES